MMLHSKAAINLGGTILLMDRQRDNHGPLGKFQARALGVRDLEVIGDLVKLPARHLKCWVIVGIHYESLVHTTAAANILYRGADIIVLVLDSGDVRCSMKSTDTGSTDLPVRQFSPVRPFFSTFALTIARNHC
jgi:hypothetical protein